MSGEPVLGELARLACCGVRPTEQGRPPVLVEGRGWGQLVDVKQYRPNVERQKMLYSMEKSRKVLRRWQGKPGGPRSGQTAHPRQLRALAARRGEVRGGRFVDFRPDQGGCRTMGSEQTAAAIS